MKRSQKKSLLVDADYHAPTNRYFFTTPPLQQGIPATLSKFNRQKRTLQPFPSVPEYGDSNSTACKNLIAVYRIFIDKCGQLWVVDFGGSVQITSADNSTSSVKCPPKLVIYDLNDHKDAEILRYEFPSSTYTDRSMFINIIVESYKSDCSDSFAYIVDQQDYGLIVFDYANRSSWRVTNKYFYPYPTDMTIHTNNITYELSEGIFGIALGPETQSYSKTLYFHSFASRRETWVPTSVLKNQTTLGDSAAVRKAFVLSPGQRKGQSTLEVMTKHGVLISALVTTNELVCWNRKKPFTMENQYVLKRDNSRFRFISGLKLTKDNKLLITSCRLVEVFMAARDDDYYNRVMVVDDVDKLLKNTPCDPGYNGRSYEYLN